MARLTNKELLAYAMTLDTMQYRINVANGLTAGQDQAYGHLCSAIESIVDEMRRNDPSVPTGQDVRVTMIESGMTVDEAIDTLKRYPLN